jgi:hypothetical protein
MMAQDIAEAIAAALNARGASAEVVTHGVYVTVDGRRYIVNVLIDPRERTLARELSEL